jgi:Flp pilus assembly protein TadD
VWISFVPFYAIGVAVFFVAERYRMPLFVPLCVCSGGAIDRLLQASRIRTTGIGPRTLAAAPRFAGAAALAAALAGAALTAWPFPLNNGRYDERLMLSKVLMNRHDYDAAATELQRAHEIQPGNSVTEFNLGIALVSAGRDTDGIRHVRNAVNANVPIPGARYALVNAMLTTGDRDGAIALLRTYYPADNETAESCFQVGVMALNAGAPRVAERYLQRALQLRPGWPEALQALQQIGR